MDTGDNGSHNQDNEELDPRVQVELEKLNTATDEINNLESLLEEANHTFRICLNETSAQLQLTSKKLGSCVEKSRPYYEAKDKAKKLQVECQRAAVQYQRANAIHQAARETIALAEERFANLLSKQDDGNEKKFDSAWQEMLNHATIKIMEAEAQKTASAREHERRAYAYTTAEKEVQTLQRSLKSAIAKSLSYFELRSAIDIKLGDRKDYISSLQKDISIAKRKYSSTLKNLEDISEEIHENRRLNMKREPGVGAEQEDCQAFVEKIPSSLSLNEAEATSREQSQYWDSFKTQLETLSPSKETREEAGSSSKFLDSNASKVSEEAPNSSGVFSGESVMSNSSTVNFSNENTITE